MEKHFIVEVFEDGLMWHPIKTYNITATSEDAAMDIALEWAEMEDVINPSVEAREYFPD